MSSGPWRELIVKHFPELQTRDPNDDGWLSVNCPIHTDKKQSAGLNTILGRFICHSSECQETYLTSLHRPTNGAKSLNIAELLHFMHGWSVQDATTVVEGYRVDRLDTDFSHNDAVTASATAESVIHFFSYEVEAFVRLANERLHNEFDQIDLAVDYATTRGLTRDTLVRAGLGYVPGRTDLPDGSTSGIHGCLLLPYWFKSRLVGVRIRQADSRKRMLLNSHYVPYNLNRVFETTSRTVVVGEGESDTLRLQQALDSAGLSNVPVIGTPGLKFDAKWARFLRRFNRVLAVPQADRPSQQQFVKFLRESFEERLEVVQIPWEEDALGGKDVCDYLLMQPQSEADFVDLLGVGGQDAEERPYLKEYDYFLARQDRTVDWLVPNVIERGSKVLIVGDPKVGKTFIALNFIKACIEGTPFLGRDEWTPTSSGLRCLLVEEEGSERAIAQRILRIIPPTEKLGVIHGEGVKLDDPSSFDRLRKAAMKFKPDIVVLDPYASLHSQDENTVDGTMRVMGAVNVLYRALPGSTIVILHHRSKLGGGARGSGALWGAVDYQLVAFRPDQSISSRTVGILVEGRETDATEAVYVEFHPETMTYGPVSAAKINIVKKSTSAVDPFVREEVERALREDRRPLSTQEIMAKVPDQDYMVVRGALLELYAHNLVERTGTGGRAGFKYEWTGE